MKETNLLPFVSTGVRKLLISALTFAVMVVINTLTANAAVSSCDDMSGIGMEKVTYASFDSASTDPMVDIGDPDPNVRLRGWLYFDATDFVYDKPVLIYNHGHNDERGEPCAIARHFVRQGFVVFAPLRRGHFGDGIKSTGIHNDVYADKCMRTQSQAAGTSTSHLYCSSSFCRPGVPCSDPDKRNAIELRYLSTQRDDISYQIQYIKARAGIGRSDKKLADPDRIALLGHSWGGAAVVFANEFDYGQNRFSFGMVGITSGQTMRVNVSNIIATNDSQLPPGPTSVAIIVVNSRGQLVRNRKGEVIRKAVELERGDSIFLNVDFDELPPGPVRVQLRAVVSVVPPSVGDTNLLQDGVCIPSVEVINSSNGKTLFMNPAVARGFNPQPDPPSPE